MTIAARLRSALTTLAAVGCTVLTLGCGLFVGARTAAPYVAAECRGFDALVASDDATARCDATQRVADVGTRATGATGAVGGLFSGLGAVQTFEFPEA